LGGDSFPLLHLPDWGVPFIGFLFFFPWGRWNLVKFFVFFPHPKTTPSLGGNPPHHPPFSPSFFGDGHATRPHRRGCPFPPPQSSVFSPFFRCFFYLVPVLKNRAVGTSLLGGTLFLPPPGGFPPPRPPGLVKPPLFFWEEFGKGAFPVSWFVFFSCFSGFVCCFLGPFFFHGGKRGFFPLFFFPPPLTALSLVQLFFPSPKFFWGPPCRFSPPAGWRLPSPPPFFFFFPRVVFSKKTFLLLPFFVVLGTPSVGGAPPPFLQVSPHHFFPLVFHPFLDPSATDAYGHDHVFSPVSSNPPPLRFLFFCVHQPTDTRWLVFCFVNPRVDPAFLHSLSAGGQVPFLGGWSLGRGLHTFFFFGSFFFPLFFFCAFFVLLPFFLFFPPLHPIILLFVCERSSEPLPHRLFFFPPAPSLGFVFFHPPKKPPPGARVILVKLAGLG